LADRRRPSLADRRRPSLPLIGIGSLQRRLTLTYTAALAVGLLVFSLVSFAAIDRTLENSLDARLAATTRAFATTAAGHVTSARVDARVVRRLLTELGIQQNGAVFTAHGAVAMQSVVVPPGVAGVARDAGSDAITYATVPSDGGLRVAALRVSSGSGDAATVVLWRPVDVIVDYERIAVTIFAAAGLAIVVLALFAGSAIVGRGLAPLGTMAEAASEIEAHDLTLRLSNRALDDELRAFADTFDRMLERLQSAFRRQRQFTADASHDLRAPLAVIRAEADLALARAREGGADDESFRSIRDEVLELDRLIDALLSAARADEGPVNATAIDLADVAARAAERLRPFAQSRSVRLAIDIARPAVVLGDAAIVERVLVSLLHNGIKFSPPGGTVAVAASAAADLVSLVVRDDGPGFSDAGLRHGFDRFWKDDAARGRGGSGTGLGLAIAKSAVERVGGSIHLRNGDEGGAEIETMFRTIPRDRRSRSRQSHLGAS
jgi:signal transduction histidine kinase